MKFKVFTKNYKFTLNEATDDEKINLTDLLFPACEQVIRVSQQAQDLNKKIEIIIKKLDDLFPSIDDNNNTTAANIADRLEKLKDIVERTKNENNTNVIFKQLSTIITHILDSTKRNATGNEVNKAVKALKHITDQYVTPLKTDLNKINEVLNNFIKAFPATTKEKYLEKFKINPEEKLFVKNKATNDIIKIILNFINTFEPIKLAIRNINRKITKLSVDMNTLDIGKDAAFINIIATADNILDADDINSLNESINDLLEKNRTAFNENSDFIISEVTTYWRQIINKTNVGTGKLYQKLSAALNSGLGYDSDEINTAWNDYLQSDACKKIHFFGQHTDYLEAIRTALLFEIKFFKSELIEENPLIEYLDKLGIILETNKPPKLNPDYFKNTYNIIHNAVQRGNLTKQDITGDGLLKQDNLIFNPILFIQVNSKDYLEYQDMLVKLANDNFSVLTLDNAINEYKDIYSFVISKLKSTTAFLGEKIKYFMGLPNLQNFLTDYRQALSNIPAEQEIITARQILIKNLSNINKLQDITTIRENLELLMGQNNYISERNAVAASWKYNNNNDIEIEESTLFKQNINIISFNNKLKNLIDNKSIAIAAVNINIIIFILYQYYIKNPGQAMPMQQFEKVIPEAFKQTKLLQPQNLFNALFKKYSVYSNEDAQKIKNNYQNLLKYSYRAWFQQEADQNNRTLTSLFNAVLAQKVNSENDIKDEK